MVLIFLFLMSVQQLLLPQKVEYLLVMFLLVPTKKRILALSLSIYPLVLNHAQSLIVSC